MTTEKKAEWIIADQKPGDSGLITFSKYPIISSHFESYGTYSQDADIFANKGVLYTLIHMGPGQYLHVFNTHLQASYYDKGLQTLENSVHVRKQQFNNVIVPLMRNIHRTSLETNTAGPMLVCGDLNVNSTADQQYIARHLKISDDEMTIDKVRSIYTVVSEYLDMIEAFQNQQRWQVVDCLEENKANIPKFATFIKEIDRSDKNKKKDEEVEEFERLDYILYVTDKQTDNSAHIKPIIEKTVIVDFPLDTDQIEGAKWPENKLSDHNGIQAELGY